MFAWLLLLMAAPAFAGEPRAPIEVKGQSRNLNMLLVLRDERDKIRFVKIRKSYRDEILATKRKE
jgi:hypothetical protein